MMDVENFKKVFLPYHGKLYGIAYRILENQTDAEDVVQETYIKLWHRRGELESLINPESYAITLLKNSCLDILRKIKPDLLAIYETNLPSNDSLITRIENQDRLAHVQYIMSKLPPQQEQIVRLKIWDNLSDAEIEKITGLTQGNIRVTISRAKRTIKKIYEKWEKNENKRFV
jgi:RNA polymerase sigma-70 factor (ECF subfamily)